MARRRSKYGVNIDPKGKRQRTANGIQFASQLEHDRYLILQFREKRGDIRELELQPAFHIEIKGKRICKYVADFRYQVGDLEIIEDVKGVKTPVYKLKKKMVEAQFGIVITEITKQDLTQ